MASENKQENLLLSSRSSKTHAGSSSGLSCFPVFPSSMDSDLIQKAQSGLTAAGTAPDFITGFSY